MLAVKLYEEALETDFSFTECVRLAKCFEQGIGFETDLTNGVALFRKKGLLL